MLLSEIKNKIIYKIVLIALALCFIFTGVTMAISQPKVTKPGSTLASRIAQRKNERALKLDEDTFDRIVSRCSRSQNDIRTTRDSYVSVDSNRTRTYNQVDAKLWYLIGGLKYIEVDTFKLQQQRSAFVTKVDNYNSLYKEFRQSLSDAVDMNCQADPTGFEALLETARIYNIEIRNQLNDITKYVNDTIQPTLSNYSDNLKVKASS